MQVDVRLLSLKTQGLQRLQAKTLNVKTWNWPCISALGTHLLVKELFYHSSCRARQRSDLFLPAGNIVTLCSSVHQQLLAVCSVLPLHPVNLMQQFLRLKKPWAKRLSGEACGRWRNYEHHLCPESGKPVLLGLCVPVAVMLFSTGVSILLTSCLTAMKLHPVLQ